MQEADLTKTFKKIIFFSVTAKTSPHPHYQALQSAAICEQKQN
jgi:hypothetical protein